MNSEAPITEVQEEEVITSPPSHLFVLFLVILGVAALSALGTYYYLKASNPSITPSYQQVTDQSNTNTDNMEQSNTVDQKVTGTEGWKTYRNDASSFSMQYPSNWTFKNDRMYQGKNLNVTLSGTQGSITIDWGGGFGGGPCASTRLDAQTQSGVINFCDDIMKDGSESLQESNDAPASKYGVGGNGYSSYHFDAVVHVPSTENKATILKMLSTFHIN